MLMVTYAEVPEDNFDETIFAEMEKLPLNVVSEELAEKLRTAFKLVKKKLNIPIATKEPAGNWMEQCLGKTDANEFSKTKGRQQIIIGQVRSFMIQQPSAILLAGLGNIFSARENLLHTVPPADLLDSIMSIFPSEKDEGYMKTVQTRMEVHQKLNRVWDNNVRRPDPSLVFLSALYSIPNIESSVKLVVNLQKAHELYYEMMKHADRLQDCIESIEMALPQIQQIFQSMLLAVNVLKSKQGEALCFDMNFFERIMSFKTKTLPMRTLLFYIVRIFCQHNDDKLFLSHDSPVKTMLFHLQHNNKLQFEDLEQSMVEMRRYIAQVRMHRQELHVAEPNSRRIEECGLDPLITNFVHAHTLLQAKQSEVETRFFKVSCRFLCMVCGVGQIQSQRTSKHLPSECACVFHGYPHLYVCVDVQLSWGKKRVLG